MNFKNIFQKFLCTIGNHKYQLDNSGLTEFPVDFFKCNHCSKYLLVINGLLAVGVRRLLLYKKRHDLLEQKRCVIVEKFKLKIKKPKLLINPLTGEINLNYIMITDMAEDVFI